MNAEVIPFPIEHPTPRICVPCMLIWLAAPAFWVGVFAWVVLR